MTMPVSRRYLAISRLRISPCPPETFQPPVDVLICLHVRMVFILPGTRGILDGFELFLSSQSFLQRLSDERASLAGRHKSSQPLHQRTGKGYRELLGGYNRHIYTSFFGEIYVFLDILSRSIFVVSSGNVAV